MDNRILFTHDDVEDLPTELPINIEAIGENMLLSLSDGLLGITIKFDTNIELGDGNVSDELPCGTIIASKNVWEQAIIKYGKPLLNLSHKFEYTWFCMATINNRLCLCAFTALLKRDEDSATYVSPYTMFNTGFDMSELNEAVSEVFYSN